MTKHFCDFCGKEQLTSGEWKLLKVYWEMEISGVIYDYQSPNHKPIRVCGDCFSTMEKSLITNPKATPMGV